MSIGTRLAGRVFVIAALMMVCASGLSGAWAQSQLPADIQADLLKRQIFEAVRDGDFASALRAFDDYKKLNVPLPPALQYMEAKAAAEAGDDLRALEALTKAMPGLDRDSSQYKEALALFPQYQARAEAATRRREQERAAAAARAAEAERVLAETARREAEAAVPALLARIADEMVAIPGGKFRMGSKDGDSGERSVRSVSVLPFKLGKYEVTFDQYDVFAKATGRALPPDAGLGRGNRPVINVNRDDAKAYAAWLSEVSGQRYRLPSEAEWEYAARAGTTTAYPWGEAFSADQANGNGTSGRDTFENTAPVGSFPPNAWGLHDMIGNVYEWTEDCWNASYAGAPADGSAWTSGDCSRRVIRGGSWGSGPASCACRAATGTTRRTATASWGFVSPRTREFRFVLCAFSLCARGQEMSRRAAV